MDKDEKKCRELLSKNIKRYRERLGFSQLDLSLELGISATFLSSIETCQKWVSPKILSKIAKALKIEVYELFKPADSEDSSEVSAKVADELVKYLNIVDDTLVKQIAHSIQPAIEKTIKRSITKTRRYYKNRLK